MALHVMEHTMHRLHGLEKLEAAGLSKHFIASQSK